MFRADSSTKQTASLGQQTGAPEVAFHRDCPVCQSRENYPLFPNRKIPSVSDVDASRFSLVICKSCQTMYVNPAPVESALIDFYPRDYYAPSSAGFFRVIKKTSRTFSPLEQFTLNCISSGAGSHKRVFELGCAAGDNLVPFSNAGWQAIGFEPNARLAQIARERGIDVQGQFLSDEKRPFGLFDVIILSHVLEHTYDPTAVLRNCKQILAEGGRIYLEVPLIGRALRWLFGRYHGNLEFPVHLTLAPEKSLIRVIHEAGFGVHSARRLMILGTTRRTLNHRFPRIRETGPLGSVVVVFADLMCEVWLTIFEAASTGRDAVAFECSAAPNTRAITPPS